MYNKLFTKILDSSIWLESDSTRLVWLTLLAAMDEDGFAQFASVANLAHRARVTLDACSEAVRCLESDDLNSSDGEHGGRRIERVAGGWMVLNAEKYRLMVTRVVARERNRERVKRFRERIGNAPVMAGNAPVTPANVPVTPSDTDTDTDTDTNTGSEAVAADSGQKLSTNVKHVNDVSALSAHSRSRVQKQSTEAEAVADSGPPSAAIREPGLILSPARYAQRLRFCAFVGSKIEIPNDLHAELRARHGGTDPETSLQNWYVSLNDRAETEAWQIPTGKAIFAWVKDHYAVAFPPTPAPVAVVTRDRMAGQAKDQQQKTQEVIRLMRDEGLSREAAMSRVFR